MQGCFTLYSQTEPHVNSVKGSWFPPKPAVDNSGANSVYGIRAINGNTLGHGGFIAISGTDTTFYITNADGTGAIVNSNGVVKIFDRLIYVNGTVTNNLRVKNSLYVTDSANISGKTVCDSLYFNKGGNVTTPATEFHIASSLTTNPRGIMSSQHNGGTAGARFHLRKSRGTFAVPTVITTGDTLGRIVCSGHDGTKYKESASINFVSSGTIGSNRIPSYLSINTGTDAAPTVSTERFRINNDGIGYFGTINASATKPAGSNTALILQDANSSTGNTCSQLVLQNSRSGGYATGMEFRATGSAYTNGGTGAIMWWLPSSNFSGSTARQGRWYFDMSVNSGSGDPETILLLSTANADKRIGMCGVTYPSYSLSFMGTLDRTIGIERNSTAATAGKALTLRSGGAIAGSADLNSGPINLTTGISTGLGTGDASISTTINSTTGTGDNSPTEREKIAGRLLLDNNMQYTGAVPQTANSFYMTTAGRSGIGMLTWGDGAEYAWFSFTTAGVVTLITNSGNVECVKTNDKVNIIDGGTSVYIINEMGANATMSLKILYNL